MATLKGIVRGQFVSELAVPEDGIRLESIDGRHRLVPVSDNHNPVYPMDRHGLHREFAALDSKASILKFANRFGFLESSSNFPTTGSPSDGREKNSFWGTPVTGEPLEAWSKSIIWIRHLVRVFDAAQSNEAWLPECVEWQKRSEPQEETLGISKRNERPEAVVWRSLDDAERGIVRDARVISSEYDRRVPPLYKSWKYRDAVEPAHVYVFLSVNEILWEHVRPAILPYWTGDLKLLVRTLLGAIVSQFSLELTGLPVVKIPCKGCGEKFAPNRSSNLFHSPTCRRAYARRQKG